MKKTNHTRMFSLVEILIVLAIMSILIAIILPVILKAKKNARSVSCLSNLQQIWQASAMYGSDYDDHFPYGVSNANKEISYLKHRDDKDKILEMAPINSVLHPYIKNDALWKCPSDFGGDHIFLTSIDKKNNFYDSFNVSYFYDFRFALKNKHFSSVTAWLGGCPYPEINESKIILFCDQSLLWHSSNTGKEWDIGLEFVLNFRVNGISIGGNLLKDIKSDRYFTPHWLLFNEEDRFSVPC